jgi:hypothetical protein
MGRISASPHRITTERTTSISHSGYWATCYQIAEVVTLYLEHIA